MHQIFVLEVTVWFDDYESSRWEFYKLNFQEIVAFRCCM